VRGETEDDKGPADVRRAFVFMSLDEGDLHHRSNMEEGHLLPYTPNLLSEHKLLRLHEISSPQPIEVHAAGEE
jgi:hypothetical protein